MNEIQTRLELGQLLITPAAREALLPADVRTALDRHAQGDWGDVTGDDAEANDEALENEGRLFSVYHNPDGLKFWVITESDHSATTVMLPEDY